ncbi:hypothetical protein GN244_ATG07169 [Phytophthora infestans]|uniref:RxLR effector protein n=1 Tax=Phytophthora infestans TaxID=4787 RepID=A0A833WWZ2_PHYIN|nr:hypothetical protein GN244_ATG07169 [Phytophthora infestans]
MAKLVPKICFQKLRDCAKSIFKTDNQLTMATPSFPKLRLDKAKSDFFLSEAFDEWARHNNSQSSADDAMFNTFGSHYGDDDLARMLTTAKPTSENSIVTRLREMENCREKYECSNTYDQNLLKTSALGMWINNAFNTLEKPVDEIVRALKAHNDDVLVAKLMALSRNDVSSGMAWKLERSLTETWQRNESLLRFNEEGTSRFTNPALGIWVSYAMRKSQDPFEFVKGIDDAQLARMLGTATKRRLEDPTSNGWVAGNAEFHLLNTW